MSGCIVGPAIACRDRPAPKICLNLKLNLIRVHIHILNPESLKLESRIRWLAADSAELSFALSAGMGVEGGAVLSQGVYPPTFADDIQKMQLSLLVAAVVSAFCSCPAWQLLQEQKNALGKLPLAMPLLLPPRAGLNQILKCLRADRRPWPVPVPLSLPTPTPPPRLPANCPTHGPNNCPSNNSPYQWIPLGFYFL